MFDALLITTVVVSLDVFLIIFFVLVLTSSDVQQASLLQKLIEALPQLLVHWQVLPTSVALSIHCITAL